jgi:hypothetical protein
MSIIDRGPEPAGPSTGEARESVAVHDQVLWRDLVSADTAEAFAAAWLGLACRVISGAAGGILLLARRDGAAPELVASWPSGVVADAELFTAAQRAMKEARGVVQPPPAGSSSHKLRAAYPIQLDGAVVGVVALDVEAGASRDPRDLMRHLQWSVAWIRDFLRRRRHAADRESSERATLALDLIAAALEESTVRSACRVAATELALRLGCERVSFGFLVRGHIEIAGISHSAQFGKRMNLVQQLAEAMEEAIDQQAVVLFPAPAADGHLLVRAHEALSKGHGAGFVLTVPMFVNDRFVGAAAFERAAADPFDQSTIDVAEAVASILGPALLDKRLNDRLLITKCFDSAVEQVRRLLGVGHIGRKLVAIAAIATVALFYLVTGEYRVSATGQVEGVVQRSIVAPFDGFIAEAPGRAGDVVKKGALLATLDTRDLALERLRWVTERQQHLYEYDQALSKQERADALKYQSLLRQAEAQVRLVDEQLARAQLTAPFDGLVVSGDLTQSIGATVRRGDVLFEVAPLENYRVELRVSESQIADVKLGQHGELVVAALPEQVFPFTIERITPVAAVRDGSTYFAVDGRLDASSERLRPGMEGVGKIDIGKHRLIWIWSRSMLHWARLTAWKWVP